MAFVDLSEQTKRREAFEARRSGLSPLESISENLVSALPQLGQIGAQFQKGQREDRLLKAQEAQLGIKAEDRQRKQELAEDKANRARNKDALNTAIATGDPDATAQQFGITDPLGIQQLRSASQLKQREKQQAATLKGEQLRKAREPTPAQSKTGAFAARLFSAEKELQDIQTAFPGFDRTSTLTGLKSILPRELQSEALLRTSQAENNWVEAFLREVSGAAIPEHEIEQGANIFFPRRGDPPAVVAQKLRARQTVEQSFREKAGISLKGFKQRFVAQGGNVLEFLGDVEGELGIAEAQPGVQPQAGPGAVAAPQNDLLQRREQLLLRRQQLLQGQ